MKISFVCVKKKKKTFSNRQEYREFVTRRFAPKEIIEDILQLENKSSQKKLRNAKDKEH